MPSLHHVHAEDADEFADLGDAFRVAYRAAWAREMEARRAVERTKRMLDWTCAALAVVVFATMGWAVGGALLS